MFVRPWIWSSPQLKESGRKVERVMLRQLRPCFIRLQPGSSTRLVSSTCRVFEEIHTKKRVQGGGNSSQRHGDDVITQPEPRSKVSRPRPGTSMIRELLGYDKKKWNILRSCIRDNLAAARLDWSRRLRDQDKKKLAIAYHAVEQQFPETRRFENQWAVKRIAQQYWNQRKYHIRSERIASSSLDSLEGKDDFPARTIPRLDPIYKVPMSVIRTYIGYDKREWNSLRTCVRENLMAVSLDWSVPWRAQQPEKLVQAYDAVRVFTLAILSALYRRLFSLGREPLPGNPSIFSTMGCQGDGESLLGCL
ncbi:hypothetical protein F5878DRAFT_409219 [Lentinula raphanica]|uniref:Uncharacterized protein n=1 Tax=Lentinula raphanica TaxID=153919 RepID=A0AA38PGJ9_9AGAR|nr:hypothetical protein F5878DRAFT_409219 [Lentinula raphanica]